MNLSSHQKTEIANKLKEYLSEKELSQAQFCKISDIGEAYVSHIIQGKNKIGKTEIKDKYYLSICKAIDYTIDIKIWRHFNTDNFKMMINKLKWARANAERLVLDGDTGAGKSYTCKKYKQVYPVNTFLIKCDPNDNCKEFSKSIAEEVGVETYGTTSAIIKRVCKKLLTLENACIIIDEAEHVEKKLGYINIFKSMADKLEDEVPFVIVGMDIIKILKKGYEKRKQNFRQTARRFSKRERCDEDIREDIYKICEELGIKNKPVQNFLANRIKNFGELKAIIVDAIEEATKTNKPVSLQLVKTLYDERS